jgi:hypothetical protein
MAPSNKDYLKSFLTTNELIYFRGALNDAFSIEAIRRGADKSLAFPISFFLFVAQPKEFFLDGLKKLEQRSHKCVRSSGGEGYVNTSVQSRSLFFSF